MAAILAIVDPPKAEIGKVYMGRVVNITKFGAFVNILPGRDGLVHISKLGGGKRINSVEDVLELGQEIEVTRRRDRRPGQGQPGPGRRRARVGRCSRASVVRRRSRSSPGDRAARRRARQRLATPSRPSRSRRASTPSSPASSATSARPASVAATTVVAVAVTAVATAAATAAVVVVTADSALTGLGEAEYRSDAPTRSAGWGRSAVDPAAFRRSAIRRLTGRLSMSERVVQLPSGLTDRRRTDGVDANRGDRRVGRRRRPRRGRRARPGSVTSSSTCCSRAPTTRSAIEISQTIDRVGGDINAFTSKEYTAYYCRLPARLRVDRHRTARRRPHVTGAARRRHRERAPGDPRGAGDGRRQPGGRRAACLRRVPCSVTMRSAATPPAIATTVRGLSADDAPCLLRRPLPHRQHGGGDRRGGRSRRGDRPGRPRRSTDCPTGDGRVPRADARRADRVDTAITITSTTTPNRCTS